MNKPNKINSYIFFLVYIYYKMKIFTIFAGREENLHILCKYLDKALKEKKIDEVHFWNFTRKDSDFQFLKNISNIRRTSETGDYIESFPQILNNTLEFNVKAINDIHIKIRDSNKNEFEIVIGGWNNTQSVIRKNSETVLTTLSPQILHSSNFQSIRIEFPNNQYLHVYVDNNLFMVYPIQQSFFIEKVFLKTAHQSEGIFLYPTTKNNGYFLMDVSNKKNWCEYYQHYHHSNYHNDVIIKSDDDIIFLDLNKIDSFTNRILHTDFDILFANIINNGIASYYQQVLNLIPPSIMELEYPNENFGTLWNSGKKAENLHTFFIKNIDSFLQFNSLYKNKDIIQIYNRFSINFFIIKGSNWYKIKDSGTDDEYHITITYNQNKRVKLGMYLHFFVSHLSFYRQIETHMDVSSIRQKYLQLSNSILS